MEKIDAAAEKVITGGRQHVFTSSPLLLMHAVAHQRQLMLIYSCTPVQGWKSGNQTAKTIHFCFLATATQRPIHKQIQFWRHQQVLINQIQMSCSIQIKKFTCFNLDGFNQQSKRRLTLGIKWLPHIYLQLTQSKYYFLTSFMELNHLSYILKIKQIHSLV